MDIHKHPKIKYTSVVFRKINHWFSGITNLSKKLLGVKELSNGMKPAPTISLSLTEIIKQHHAGKKQRIKRQTSRREYFPRKPVDINYNIIQALNSCQTYGVCKAVTIAQDLEDELPSIKAMDEEIHLLFVNIIKNAIDAMRDAPEKMLSISSRKTGDGISIEVSDTGCGIKKSRRQKIFYSLYTTKGKYNIGLGLTMCKSILTKYKGSIKLSSKLTKGTCIKIFFPSLNYSG